jgi:hypothetical protein
MGKKLLQSRMLDTKENFMPRKATSDAITKHNQKPVEPPRSLAIAQKGIKTDSDFAALMSSLMSDLVEGKIIPSVGNATCNAGGKLLKVVEMRCKYGTKNGEHRSLVLSLDNPAPEA